MTHNRRALGFLGATGAVAGATAIAAILRGHVDSSDLTMLYLLGVVITAITLGRGPAIVAALLSVAAFDFLFVPPRFTLRVSDARYLVTFAVLLVVAVITGTLTASMREQRERARLRERRIAMLHRLSHDLALRSGSVEVLEALVARIDELPGLKAAAILSDNMGGSGLVIGDSEILDGGGEQAAARSVLTHGRPVGFPPGAGGHAPVCHLPLVAGTKVNGVLSLRAVGVVDSERLEMIRALTSLTALALERCRLAEDARQVQMQVDTERARNALLSSVSHDLRTPLAAIMGSASTLRDDANEVGELGRRELAGSIFDQAERLNRLVGNLLDMTRLESGTLQVRKEWHSLEEVIGASLTRLGSKLAEREVAVLLPPDLPLVPIDDVLFEQVMVNLLENAHQYSPPGGPIVIRAWIERDELLLTVVDRGPGLTSDERERVFEKFYRGAGAAARPGAGLGLAICRGIVEAHGGAISAENASGGGSLFRIGLPLEGTPPTVEQEEALDSAAPGRS